MNQGQLRIAANDGGFNPALGVIPGVANTLPARPLDLDLVAGIEPHPGAAIGELRHRASRAVDPAPRHVVAYGHHTRANFERKEFRYWQPVVREIELALGFAPIDAFRRAERRESIVVVGIDLGIGRREYHCCPLCSVRAAAVNVYGLDRLGDLLAVADTCQMLNESTVGLAMDSRERRARHGVPSSTLASKA